MFLLVYLTLFGMVTFSLFRNVRNNKKDCNCGKNKKVDGFKS